MKRIMSATKTFGKNQRHSKRDDVTVLSLREELQLLYKSLQNKNDELISLERIILERDTTINGLTKECQRLMSSGNSNNNSGHIKKTSSSGAAGGNSAQRVQRNSGNSAPAIAKSFSSNIESDRMAKQNEIAIERSDSSLIANTSNAEMIREQNESIKELNEKVIRLTRNLNYMQRNVTSKEEKIVELQNEIDKFRQIIRPLTQKVLERRKCDCLDEWNDHISGIGDWSPGVESTRVLAVSEPRIKRQAISAEPLSAMVKLSEEDGLIRIPKSSL